MPAAQPADPAVDEARRLGEVVNGHPEHVEQTLARLVTILNTTKDPRVVQAAVEALGHAWHPLATVAVLEHVRPDHGDPGVRLALARALPAGIDVPGQLRERAINALSVLTADTHARVRDWAAFGLGQLEAECPPARQALAAMLADPDPDARCEALLALAATGDQRALTAVHQRLQAGDQLWRLELEAAATLAAPQLHPALQRLAARWAGQRDDFTETLSLALARCAPGAAAMARQVEDDIVQRVRALVGEAVRVELEGGYPRTALTVSGHRDATGHGNDLHLPLWAEGERPQGYRVQDVVSAVRAALAHHEP